MLTVLRRLKSIIVNPKSEIRRFTFWCFMGLDKNFIPTWKLVDQTPGWLRKMEAYLLFYVARKCSSLGSIVEIGSYEGKSTIALASGAPEGLTVYAIDPHTGDKTEVEAGLKIDTYESFLKNTKNFKNIRAIRKLSVDATGDISSKDILFLFIDGWHSEAAVNEDIKSYLPLCSRNCTIVFDDWPIEEVSAGIRKNLKILPPLIGVVGKQIIFSNDKNFTRSFFARIIKVTAPISVLNNYNSIH